MVYPFLLRSTLLRTQHPHLPQTFRRYKSITAAIERGRQGGPDRPSRPRTTTRAPPEDGGGGDYKTRRELRFERFGPAKEEKEGTEREERPRRDRDERVSSPRSSRFGRVGSPRSRDDFPSQFSEGRDDKPFRPREDRPDRARDDRPPRENRFSSSPGRPARSDGEGKSSSDRFEGRERPGRREDDGGLHRKYDRFGSRPYEGGDRKPFDRGDKPFFDRGDRKPFDRGDRPFDRSDRKSYDGGDRKPYDRGDRKPFDRGDRKPYEGADQKPFDRSDSKPFDGDSTKPFHGGDRKPFDRGDHKSFDGDRKPYDRGDKKQFDKGDRTPFDGPRREAFGQRGSEFRSERPERSYNRRDESSSYTRDRPRREQTTESVEMSRDSTRDPESLPYTTAASEFIYGYSSVLAAMKANRRKLYSLYVHSRGASRDGLLARIRALKLFPITKEVGDEYMRAMDKASSGRPHNGVILESSPLPVPPITELKPASFEDESFSVSLDSQTAEDALVNGKQELYSYKAAGWRHPLVLYVDGVLDEGNLGAIARSAYFLGVDAIITPTRQIAPWSHIALKASAGAAEAIPLFKVGEPAEFLGKSSRAGWRIYASDSVPPPSSTTPDVEDESSSNIVYTFARSTKRLPTDHSPVTDHPTILMMGAEGAGLRDGLLNLAHYKVGIRHGRDVDEIGVDSLNVSVAASILCYEMLQKPKPKSKPVASIPEEEEAMF